MNTFFRKKISKVVRTVFCASLTFVVSGAGADDIEIYEAIGNAQQAVGDAEFNPNILFVLDNSGSMGAFIVSRVDLEDDAFSNYDPTEDYGDSGIGDDFYLYDEDFNSLDTRITAEQNVCLASINYFNSNVNEPFYTDTFTRWRRRDGNKYRWDDNLFNSTNSNRVLECEADAGIHGLNSASSDRYPRDRGNNNTQSTPQYNNDSDNNYPYNSSNRSEEWTLVTENYNAFLEGLEDSATTVLTSGDEDDVEDRCRDNGDRFEIESTGETFICFTRLQTMKNALSTAILGDPDAPDGDEAGVGFTNVNIGLMRFNRNDANDNHGGTLIDAVADIDAMQTEDGSGNTLSTPISNRDDFINKLDAIDFELNTPLAESAYEAYLYFAGERPLDSELSGGSGDNEYLDLTSVTSPGSSSNRRYDSPIGTNECQDNYMVLLSDGSPTQDTGSDDLILDLPNLNDSGCGGQSSSCLDEATEALYNNFNVTTFTIAFEADINHLEAAANRGSSDDAEDGSGYFLADDFATLQNAFRQIVSDIVEVENDNFVAPAVTVNAFNRLQNRSDIYYAVFEPALLPRWNGNIKKYNVSSNATIIDQDGDNAVDPTTGFFVDNESDRARSFWSLTPDGAAVAEGGFSAELGTNRQLLINFDSGSTAISAFNASDPNAVDNFYGSVINLDATGALIGVNDSLAGTIGALNNRTNSDLENNFEGIIRFSLGENISPGDAPLGTATPNNYVAESLHSTPVVLSYGTTDAEPRDIVFVATNQGMIHAINGQGGAEDPIGGEVGVTGGTERWAYIPDPDLLENLGGYFNDSLDSSSDHIYGLDGELAFDVARDSTGALTKANMFFGQRRGGNKYFAIDVLNARNAVNPVTKLWTKEGGAGGDYPRMADTWGRPIVTNFRSCTSGTCELIPALVLAGGYDAERYDDIDADIVDLSDDVTSQNGGAGTLGNSIYIVRADTGAILWSTSNSNANVDTNRGDVVVTEMDHSIPSAPTVLDITQDGAMDVMFAVDVSGQMFRFDFRNVADSDGALSESRTGGRIADLQESGVNRRFFNPLDAVFLPQTFDDSVQLTGRERIALATGTGYRAHPVQDEGFENRFYVIHDENLSSPLLDENSDPVYEYVETVDANGDTVRNVITGSDVPALNSSLLVNTPILEAATTHRYGFRVSLDSDGGSKIINPTLISDFQLIGVSYDPEGVAINACSATPGQSTAYQIDLLDGEVSVTELSKAGVSAAPVLVYILGVDDSGKETLEPVVIIGTEPFAGEDFDIGDIDLGKAVKKAWWEQGRNTEN